MRAAVALAGVLIVSLIAPGQAAATGKPRLDWTPCFADVGPFECATAHVPLDYDRPRDATISIALTRLPATDPRRRIGSLFLNPGGPGGSGVEFVVGAGPFLYTDEVRARFDLVGFDPRGIYRSTALQCFDSPEEWEPWFVPIAFPNTREEERLWIAADRFLTLADTSATANTDALLGRFALVVLLPLAAGDDLLRALGASAAFLALSAIPVCPVGRRMTSWSGGRGRCSPRLPQIPA